MIIRHQRASASNRGFRQLAGYIRGRSDKPRATWFLAANLPGVTGPHDLELACRLVEAVHAQNTRASNNRTYHMVISLHPEDRSLNGNELRRVVEHLVETLGFSGHQYIAARHNDKDHEHVHVAINKIHPETFRIHSPAWDHQKLLSAGRSLEAELALSSRPATAPTHALALSWSSPLPDISNWENHPTREPWFDNWALHMIPMGQEVRAVA